MNLYTTSESDNDQTHHLQQGTKCLALFVQTISLNYF